VAAFSITGEFITLTARELWAEGEYEKALIFLKTAVPDMGLENQIEVIEGRNKLTGVKDVDFVSDDWIMPNDYPKFSDMLNKAKIGYAYYQQHVEKQIIRATEIHSTFSHYYDEYTYLTNDQWTKLTQEWQLLLPEAKEGLTPPFYLSVWLRATYRRTFLDEKLERNFINNKSVIYKNAHLGIFDNRETYDRWCAYYFVYEPDRSEIWNERNDFLLYIQSKANITKPEPYIAKLDYEMDCEFGWLLPNGDYYGCLWMCHIKLASALMPDSENPEHSLEKLGAVKIHMDDYMDFHITSGDKKTTDEQNTKIFKYCMKHNKDYHKYRLD
jgi:hypothetical protein